MTNIPCWTVHLILDVAPLISWGYAVCVWAMYATAHEFTWASRVPSILGRTSWLVAAVATSIGLCRANETTLVAVIPTGVIFVCGSALLCRWTRVYDVVGIPKPPYFGSRHLEHCNVLCTGANSGIGKETTIQLASMGATVYLLCRSTTRAQQAVEDILKHHSHTIQPSQLKVCAMDLGDFSSIKKAIGTELKDVKVNILVNNAGLMMGTKTLSKDGLELMMQANHLGHFLLTRLLLSKSMFAKEARILNVTSSTYQLANQIGFDFDDMMCESTRKYTLFGQYAQTKLANILFTKELIKRYPDLHAFAVHPGIVRTNVSSNMPGWMQLGDQAFAWIVATMQKLPEQGAYSNVLCAAAPLDDLPPNASYISNCQSQALTKIGESPADADRLWTVSEKLVGL